MSSLIHLLIYLLIVGVVVGVVFYVADVLPIPEPLNKIIKIVAVVGACIIVIYALLNLTGTAVSLG